jgi:signal transduction histidine kinase
MPTKLTTPRFRIAGALQQIGSPYALSNETLIGASVPVILSNLVLDFGREQGSFGSWLLIAVLGYLSVVAVLLLIRQIIGTKRLPAVFYLLAFLIAGAVRGAVIYSIGRGLGAIPASEWQYRMLGSPLFILISLSLVAVLVSNSVRATNELKALQTSRLVLEQRLSSMRTEIAKLNAEVAGRVSGLISPVIQDLMAKITQARSSELKTEIKALRSTVDDVIRPLSLSIAENTDEITVPMVKEAKVGLLQNYRLDVRLQVANQIVPFWSAALITLMSTPAALIFYQTDAFTALLIFAFTTLLVLELASVALRSIKAKARVAFFIQLSVFACAGLASTFALNLAELDAGLYPVARIVALTLVIGLAMFIGQVRQTQRYESQEAAREVNEQLELLNSQARRELWLNRRRIATVLHGPVQAALYSSAMRLAQSKRPTKKLIQSVNQDLESALEILKFERASSVNLRDVLQQISDVWAGTCDVYFNVSKPAYVATKKDANLSEAAIELIREAVSNAIKHGSASEVDIDVRLGAHLLEISVTNNGEAPVNREGTGFGSKLYSELSHNWQLTKLADDRTRFSATVASV